MGAINKLRYRLGAIVISTIPLMPSNISDAKFFPETQTASRVKAIETTKDEFEGLDYFETVEKIEQKNSFSEVYGTGSKMSKIQLTMTTINDLCIIKEVDSAEKSSLDKKYLGLKDLIGSLDDIYSKKMSKEKKLAAIYNELSGKIHPKMGKQPILKLDELIAGYDADCTDIASAYNAFFNFYGIHSSIRYGRLNDGGLHAWVHVTFNNRSFDLDPSWYPEYVELKERIKDFKGIVLSKEVLAKNDKSAPYMAPDLINR